MATATDKTLSGITNLVKLLPTTTLFAFQTLNPSFTNHGECLRSNRFLTASLLLICTVTCAFFSITDSIVHKGKLYYGFATFADFHVFNFDDSDGDDVKVWFKEHCRRKYRLKVSDGVHIVLNIIVFLSLGFSDGYVQSCFFSGAGADGKQLLANLPLGFGFLASMVFLLMPNTRKGIGYSSDAVTEDTDLSRRLNLRS